MHSETTRIRPEITRTQSKKGTPQLEELIAKASQGDPDALYELCEKIAKDVLFRATYIMGNQTDASDVAQEVLIRICAKIQDLRDPKVFGVWLSKIISNEARRHMAANARHGMALNIDDYLETAREEKDDFLPHKSAENKEYRKAVMEIIASLPMRQREAVIFHYYNGLSITQTAEAMSVTKQSASQYLMLAREKLKYSLEKRKLGAESLGMLGAGPLLSEGIFCGAERFVPANEAWTQQALAQCKAYLQLNPPPSTGGGSSASKAPLEPLLGAFAMVAAVSALFAGMWLVAAPLHIGGAPKNDVCIEGKVLFSDGTNYGTETVCVNPGHAEPSTDSSGGKLTAVCWWITEAGNENSLYSGDGGVVEDALLQLKKSGTDGEYMLYFRLEDEAGSVHKLGGNFYILTNSQ